MSHLPKEKQEEENRRIEEDTTYDVTPEVSVQVTEDRNHPASEAKAAEPHKKRRRKWQSGSPGGHRDPEQTFPSASEISCDHLILTHLSIECMTTKDRQTQTNINRLPGQLTLKHTVNNNTVYFQEK